MSDPKKPTGMKSAYELALERLEREGIERPRDEALTGETKRAIAEARKVTESKLAELEILHRSELAKTGDWSEREELEARYRRDRERLTAEGEAKVSKLRGG